jgi:hypothetical protein
MLRWASVTAAIGAAGWGLTGIVELLKRHPPEA